MNEKLNDAMNEIRDEYIVDAAKSKRRLPKWLGAVAAVLVVVLVWYAIANPFVTAKAISLADYSGNTRQNYETVIANRDLLTHFFMNSITQVLSDCDSENQAFSPLNLYLALAAVAELSGGDRQILDLLCADNLEDLRTQAHCIWNASYRDKDNQCLLANSLWLDQDLSYVQSTMDTLSQYYYTSVYRGDFGSVSTDRSISAWLNQQTGGLLKNAADNIHLDAETVFALYSTIYFQAKWTDEFSASANTKDTFHAATGDITCTYMNRQRMQGNYYWGDCFGAITVSLKDGSKMWLILPDEGKTPDDVLDSDDLGPTLFGAAYTQALDNSKYMLINLSLPKFDIRSNGDLKSDLQALGVTDVFDPNAADFTAISNSDGPLWLTSVNQATRVATDEEGVTAASYIEIPAAGSPAPPEEIIDFVLDRPFIFVITNTYNLPLFAGVVNQP